MLLGVPMVTTESPASHLSLNCLTFLNVTFLRSSWCGHLSFFIFAEPPPFVVFESLLFTLLCLLLLPKRSQGGFRSPGGLCGLCSVSVSLLPLPPSCSWFLPHWQTWTFCRDPLSAAVLVSLDPSPGPFWSTPRKK